MGVITKLQSCCCGCSLELGTNIIFWISVLFGISTLVNSLFGGDGPASAYSRTGTCSAVFEAIVAGIGLYAVANKKAQLLLPYVILSAVMLVLLGLLCVLVLVLVFFAGDLAKTVIQGSGKGAGNPHNADTVAAGLTFLIIVYLVLLCIVFVVKWYCLNVVYSYYCQLKEEAIRAPANVGAPGYVVPPEQGQPGYNYPPSYGQQPPPGYVPAYGQPAAVYPTTETKN